MDKLTLNDIKILGEGPQVKKLIEAKYGTLKNFHQQESPSISLKSVMNYCSSKKIYSGTFKCLVVNKLDKGWEEIILSESEQVKSHVYEVCNNIVLYNEESDIELFNKLIDLCTKYKLVNEKALMHRNIAKNYYYRNDKLKVIEYYNKAIELIGNQNFDTLISLTIELADHYFMEQYVDEAKILFRKARSYIEDNQVSNAAMYKYYYRMGVVSNIESKYDESRSYLEKSIEYAEIQTEFISEKGAAFLTIGSTYKREGNYEKAKENYYCSLTHFHDKDIQGRTSALNNLADIYCILQDYAQATKFIEKALNLLEKDRITNRYLLIYQTYAEIKLMTGDTSGCYEYFDILKRTINSSINKKDIKNNINVFINRLEDVELLIELYRVILYIKENTNSCIYIDDLYCCMGRIYEKIRKKEKQNEKV